MLKKIYNKIEEDAVSISVKEFKALPKEISTYKVAYVGKHRAIQPHASNSILELEDMQLHLLIECRIFNENEEIYIFPRQGKLYQRTIKSGDEVHKYIRKSIQLRNDKDHGNDKNDVLEVRHYINADLNGYSILRYVKITK